MAEYIEREKLYKRISDIRIYASVARQSGKDLAGELLKFYREGVLKAIADAPAADVVEVVRCKDCKHARKLVSGDYSCLIDQRIAHDEMDYCSYGERGEENEKTECR